MTLTIILWIVAFAVGFLARVILEDHRWQRQFQQARIRYVTELVDEAITKLKSQYECQIPDEYYVERREILEKRLAWLISLKR
ncbi:unnamed protein product [marine sediment metagenome]|uniref:Uncharacterized protein n=1 Tax=marine sediment metagenome TaxID=412755 RepID=X0V1W3_9ZZZZ